jgi:hypothetical protein
MKLRKKKREKEEGDFDVAGPIRNSVNLASHDSDWSKQLQGHFSFSTSLDSFMEEVVSCEHSYPPFYAARPDIPAIYRDQHGHGKIQSLINTIVSD